MRDVAATVVAGGLVLVGGCSSLLSGRSYRYLYLVAFLTAVFIGGC